ncbi:MAG: V4R domain-containing protein, partial [Candidatus Nanohalobium sp.]
MNPEEVNNQKEDFFWRVRVSQNFEGDEDGRIEYRGKRFNVMGSDYFMSGIIESLSEIYAGASGGIIRETGIGYGKELLELIDEGEGDERFGNFLGFLQFLGYSEITVKEESIEVESSPTAEEHLKEDYEQKKTCYFLAGILTGAVQSIYNLDVNYVEEKCKADGDNECVFKRKE